MPDAIRRSLKADLGPDGSWAAAVSKADIEVLSLDAWETGASWSVPRRRLPDSWCFMPEQGSIVIDVAKRSYECRPGSLLLLPEGCEHSIHYAAGSRRARMLSVHATCLDEAGGQLFAAFSEPVLPCDRRWLAQWRLLVATWQAVEGAARAEAAALLRLLLIDLARGDGRLKAPSAGTDLDRRIRSALQRMRARPWENVAEHARALAVSPGRLRVLFSEHLGRAPLAVLRDLRLGMALRLLRQEGALPLAEVARRCGYASQQYFHQDFRRRMGSSPGRWRQSQTPV